jgi:acyl transferase domain-containing protein
LIGQSSGKIAAAYCIGPISRDSAWKIAYLRGALSPALSMFGRNKGAMMAVSLSAAEVESYLGNLVASGQVTVGCKNSPRSVTISGARETILDLQEKLRQDNVFFVSCFASTMHTKTPISKFWK